MSDKPEGPGWWLASDGTWHPPELHPSVREDVAGPTSESGPSTVPLLTALPPEEIAPAAPAVPTLVVPQTLDTPLTPGTVLPSLAGPEATVSLPEPRAVAPRPVPSLPLTQGRPSWSAEADHRPEAGPMYPDLFQQAVSGSRLADAITVNFADGEHRESLDVPQSSGPIGDPQLVAAGARMPAEVGAFTGASAKKRRWRL